MCGMGMGSLATAEPGDRLGKRPTPSKGPQPGPLAHFSGLLVDCKELSCDEIAALSR